MFAKIVASRSSALHCTSSSSARGSRQRARFLLYCTAYLNMHSRARAPHSQNPPGRAASLRPLAHFNNNARGQRTAQTRAQNRTVHACSSRQHEYSQIAGRRTLSLLSPSSQRNKLGHTSARARCRTCARLAIHSAKHTRESTRRDAVDNCILQ